VAIALLLGSSRSVGAVSPVEGRGGRAVAIALLLGSSRSVGAVSPVEGRGGDEGIPLVLATCVQGASNQSFNLVTVAP
jgi:hypothetical protein